MEGGGLSKGEVWVVGRANAQDPEGWKRPWGLWGVGLRLKEQKGPRHAPHPLSQRAGGQAQQASRARVGGANALLSSPAPPVPPVLEGPSHLPLLFSPLHSSYAPMTKQPQGEGGPGGQGTGLGAQQASQAEWAR